VAWALQFGVGPAAAAAAAAASQTRGGGWTPRRRGGVTVPIDRRPTTGFTAASRVCSSSGRAAPSARRPADNVAVDNGDD